MTKNPKIVRQRQHYGPAPRHARNRGASGCRHHHPQAQYALLLMLTGSSPRKTRKKNDQKPQNCKVEIARCTINSKNLCIFALTGTCFPSKFQGSAVFLVVKGSHTDLHRFDPRRPYSIKTRIKNAKRTGYIFVRHRPRRPYSIKTRIKTQ